ncbi:MAG: autoinducer binding domain-containing protein [Dongiaceae bacterium]
MGVQQYIDSIEKFADLTDPAELKPRLSRSLDEIGVGAWTYTVIRNCEGCFAPRYMTTYPEEWTAHYIDKDYVATDPTIHAVSGGLRPVRWDELETDPSMTRRGRKMFQEARDFGLRSGVTMPIHGPGNGYTVFGASFDRGEKDLARDWPEIRSALQLVVLGAHDGALMLWRTADDRDAVHVTDRERDCLLWTARGKTTWECAAILKLSEDTVRFYLRAVMDKMGVHSKHHAVVKAITLNLIVP